MLPKTFWIWRVEKLKTMAKLFLVPTPIGNLQDVSFRTLETLKEVDFILAEDTRKTTRLLQQFDISNKLIPHHKFNEHKTLEGMVNRLLEGATVALVSDAGTPGISDPGYLLVRACLEKGIQVECLPGPVALIPALILSGLSSDRFCFEGFLPTKKGRQKKLRRLREEERTMIFYESPHRLMKFLGELADTFGWERRASVSRELTKIHEETQRGTLAELLTIFGQRQFIKGEIVVVLAGVKES